MMDLWLHLKDRLVLWSAAAGAMIFLLAAYVDHACYDYWCHVFYYLVVVLMGMVWVLKIIVNVNKSRVEKLKEVNEELFLNLIEALATVIDERDRYTYGHAKRLCCWPWRSGSN